MKHIELLDRAAENKQKFEEIGVNHTFCAAYFTALESGNDLPDFNEVIWEEDIKAILDDCRRFGFQQFTVSSTFSSLTQTIAEFLRLGCRLEGMTEVKARYNDWRTGEKEIRAAFLLSL